MTEKNEEKTYAKLTHGLNEELYRCPFCKRNGHTKTTCPAYLKSIDFPDTNNN